MKREYKILLATSLLANFGDNLIGPFYAIYIKEAGIGLFDLGYASTLFCIATGVLMIIVGKYSDRHNKYLITIFGFFMYVVASLWYLIISSPWHLYVLQIIQAVGTACLSAPLTVLFSRFIQKGKEGTQWGLEGGGSFIIVGAAVFIGTLVVNFLGFKILFLAMFAVQITATLIQTRLYFATKRQIIQSESADDILHAEHAEK